MQTSPAPGKTEIRTATLVLVLHYKNLRTALLGHIMLNSLNQELQGNVEEHGCPTCYQFKSPKHSLEYPQSLLEINIGSVSTP